MIDIKGKYLQGCSLGSIAQEVGVSRQTIANRLKNKGVGIRGKKEAANTAYSLKNKYKEDCFQHLNSESEYWAGFLMADGNVFKNRITLVSHKKDFEHLSKFSKFVGCRRLPTVRGNECRITLSSVNIVRDLNKLGIVPNKSLFCEANNKLVKSRHFWRGVIDGDGSLGIYRQNGRNYPRLTLACGSIILMRQFKEYAQTILCKELNISSRNDRYHAVALKSKPAYLLIKEIYGETYLCLSRKEKIAADILAMEVYHS